MIVCKKNEKKLWPDTVRMPSFKKLDQNLKVDVVIIGGGICGILTAYKLKEAGYEVVVIEKEKIGLGVTERTTAFITAQHDTMYHELAKSIGLMKTKLYLEANLDAIKDYEELALNYDFDYERVDSCFFIKDNEEIINKEIEVLKKIGYNPSVTDKIPLPISISKGVVFHNQGQMNPLKLIKCLASELEIYENTEIIDFKNNVAKTRDYIIEAKKIVICTHFPIHNNLPYSIRMYQMRSFVVAIDYKDDLKGLYTDHDENGLYYRKYGDYLIIGGYDTRTGNHHDAFTNLEKHVKEYFPGSEIKYFWGNQDLVTLDNVPYIGYINSHNQDILVATGFNLWGMTSSMISANLIRDLVIGIKNKYAILYKPYRSMLNSNLLKNIGKIIANQIGLCKNRCSHLGCILKYNKAEKSWDCPCHGSRFDEEGNPINDPASKKLNLKD